MCVNDPTQPDRPALHRGAPPAAPSGPQAHLPLLPHAARGTHVCVHVPFSHHSIPIAYIPSYKNNYTGRRHLPARVGEGRGRTHHALGAGQRAPLHPGRGPSVTQHHTHIIKTGVAFWLPLQRQEHEPTQNQNQKHFPRPSSGRLVAATDRFFPSTTTQPSSSTRAPPGSPSSPSAPPPSGRSSRSSGGACDCSTTIEERSRAWRT